MDHHQKRTLTFVTIGLIFVLSGIEYGKFATAPLMTSLSARRSCGELPPR